jgi:hypothetical protein
MVNDAVVTSVELPEPVRGLWPYFRAGTDPRVARLGEYDGLDEEIDEIFLSTARLSEDHRTPNVGTHLFNLQWGSRLARAAPGLAAVHGQAAGSAYAAEAATGDLLSGTVWFTSRHQLGLTVDDWGDGLLVVAEGPTDGPPYDGAQAVLTTYGLDPRRHQELQGRWRGWWGAGG